MIELSISEMLLSPPIPEFVPQYVEIGIKLIHCSIILWDVSELCVCYILDFIKILQNLGQSLGEEGKQLGITTLTQILSDENFISFLREAKELDYGDLEINQAITQLIQFKG